MPTQNICILLATPTISHHLLQWSTVPLLLATPPTSHAHYSLQYLITSLNGVKEGIQFLQLLLV